MTQGFNEVAKSLMTFNTPATPYKGIVGNQETEIKNHNRYRRSTGMAQDF